MVFHTAEEARFCKNQDTDPGRKARTRGWCEDIGIETERCIARPLPPTFEMKGPKLTWKITEDFEHHIVIAQHLLGFSHHAHDHVRGEGFALNSINDLSGFNDLNSLISSEHLLSMMLPFNLATKWTILVSQCGMDHQKSTILWIFDTLSVGGHGCYFQPNPRIINQMSASHECTNIT